MVSTLLLVRYDVATLNNVKLMLKQRCARNVEISNVEQRQINIVYFSVDINNVIQRRNNAVIFNVEFHNVDHQRNNVVNMTIFKKLKTAKKYF